MNLHAGLPATNARRARTVARRRSARPTLPYADVIADFKLLPPIRQEAVLRALLCEILMSGVRA